MFQKRKYNFASFFRDFSRFLVGLPKTAWAFRSGRVAPAFREKILLAVSGVNDCQYCKFVHSAWAGANDVSGCEIEAILRRKFDGQTNERERLALLFAVHYAETEKKPSKEMLEKLNATYGEKTAADILRFLDMIYLANLTGNTFDGFLARLAGEKVDGSPMFDAALFMTVWPVLLPQNAFIRLRRRLFGQPAADCPE